MYNLDANQIYQFSSNKVNAKFYLAENPEFLHHVTKSAPIPFAKFGGRTDSKFNNPYNHTMSKSNIAFMNEVFELTPEDMEPDNANDIVYIASTSVAFPLRHYTTVKFGFSGNLPARFSNLYSNTQGAQLYCLQQFHVRNTRGVEKALKNLFSEHREHGEWFSMPAYELLDLMSCRNSKDLYRLMLSTALHPEVYPTLQKNHLVERVTYEEVNQRILEQTKTEEKEHILVSQG